MERPQPKHGTVEVLKYAAITPSTRPVANWSKAFAYGLAVACTLVVCWNLVVMYMLPSDRYGVSNLKKSAVTIATIGVACLLLKTFARAGCVTIFLWFALTALCLLWVG